MANNSKTLPREPWRGSQICGHQIAYGMPWSEFCPKRKAPGEVECAEHAEDARMQYGTVRIAPGNATGDPSAPLALLWEPYDGAEPVQPTEDELSRYAAILGGE
ncbi:hypothetical protein AB0P05_26455 [Streptomyces flaveolus]|uniref:hypothetical protein n=1 Tax=Streptomyces flaveolus TaxID=67297 RepID=UPI00342FE2DA